MGGKRAQLPLLSKDGRNDRGRSKSRPTLRMVEEKLRQFGRKSVAVLQRADLNWKVADNFFDWAIGNLFLGARALSIKKPKILRAAKLPSWRRTGFCIKQSVHNLSAIGKKTKHTVMQSFSPSIVTSEKRATLGDTNFRSFSWGLGGDLGQLVEVCRNRSRIAIRFYGNNKPGEQNWTVRRRGRTI